MEGRSSVNTHHSLMHTVETPLPTVSKTTSVRRHIDYRPLLSFMYRPHMWPEQPSVLQGLNVDMSGVCLCGRTIFTNSYPSFSHYCLRGRKGASCGLFHASLKEKTFHKAHLHRQMDSFLQQLLFHSQFELYWTHPQPLKFLHFLPKLLF